MRPDPAKPIAEEDVDRLLNRKGKLGKALFAYDADADSYHCPTGRTLPFHRVVKRRKKGGGKVTARKYRYETDAGLLVREPETAAGATGRVVFIDEVQKILALLEDIRYLHDLDPDRYRFVPTGSSARQLPRGSANLLPGRLRILPLSPVLQTWPKKATQAAAARRRRSCLHESRHCLGTNSERQEATGPLRGRGSKGLPSGLVRGSQGSSRAS